MKQNEFRGSFEPGQPDEAGVVSWVHIGDLHMTKAGEQNHLDLVAIVKEVNEAFAGSISFAYLPGDVAEDGSRAAYAVVREVLNQLNVPCCAIVGDHDVQPKSFENFLEAMADRTHYAFTVGAVRFGAMNAFDIPHPASFCVGEEQLSWLRQELQAATRAGLFKVLLLHCYPSDLKQGRVELVQLLREFHVRLVEMGHTHYNEIANDGRTLYIATRSTGQIEEGPVGYSITNIDGDVVSWRFLELGKLPVVVITSPQDERLLTLSSDAPRLLTRIRAKFWGRSEVVEATARLDGHTLPLHRVKRSQVWEAELPPIPEGVYPLLVTMRDANGETATDEIRIVSGDVAAREIAERDQDNALGAWPEHGLVGTQLGPNKNGRKW